MNVGGKGEAEIDIAELKDADGDVEVSVGDRIHAVVVSTSGGIVLSRKGVRNAATQRELEDAFRAGIAVEGKVDKAVKGGYEVRIARERAFCPLSQIDIARTTDPALHEGRCTRSESLIQGRRQERGGLQRKHSKKSTCERRTCASRSRSEHYSGRVASVLDFGAFGISRRNSGFAPRLRNWLVARHEPQ